jgi:coenzyme F420-reducing hydrogenase gamma subunit
VFLPGCPPSADLIYHTLNELLEGRMPDTAHIAASAPDLEVKAVARELSSSP